MSVPDMLTAEDVQKRLRLQSRAKAIEIMTRLPHVNLAPPEALRRTLRITEATLTAYCTGKITLEAPNVIPITINAAKRRVGKPTSDPYPIPYRR